MPRSLRIQYPGAHYHVMARGNRRENIFVDDADRRFFLHTLSEACAMTGWRIHAWALMGNHYHLFVETPEPNLSAGMQWLQNTCTRRHNVRHQKWGRLFGDRYKAVLVEGGSGHHYRTLMDYIHLNPVRARLVKPGRGQSVVDYPWSSVAGGYALPPRKRAPWLAAGAGLRAFGFKDTAAGRRQMVEWLDQRAAREEAATCGVVVPSEGEDARCSHLRRGWYWGSQTFAEKALGLAEEIFQRMKARDYRSAGAHKAHGLAQAQTWLRAGLDAAGLDEEMLKKTKSTDPRKVALAGLLWQHTTVSQPWIAERLQMNSAANVSQILKRDSQRRTAQKLPRTFAAWLNSVKR